MIAKKCNISQKCTTVDKPGDYIHTVAIPSSTASSLWVKHKQMHACTNLTVPNDRIMPSESTQQPTKTRHLYQRERRKWNSWMGQLTSVEQLREATQQEVVLRTSTSGDTMHKRTPMKLPTFQKAKKKDKSCSRETFFPLDLPQLHPVCCSTCYPAVSVEDQVRFACRPANP